MIQQSELRIGNLFNDEDGTPCYVAEMFSRNDGKYISDSGNNIYKESQVYPIPLSPGILEKYGFTRNGDWHYKQYFILGYITSDDNFQVEYKFAGAEGGFKVLDIKYLHQLQNLYYALAGTEFKIQL